jgi:hypothetical protein
MTETVITPADDGVKDFSHTVKCKFRVDDDVFIGRPNLCVDALIEFVELTEQIDESNMKEQIGLFRSIADLVLEDESSEVFKSRMGNRQKPISIPQMMEIIPWVMEEYGMRPTEPSSPSSTGSESPDGGQNSMGNLRSVELTSEDSQPTDS